jgi:hypothetical protein
MINISVRQSLVLVPHATVHHSFSKCWALPIVLDETSLLPLPGLFTRPLLPPLSFQIPRSTRKSVVTMRLVHTVAVWAMMSLLLNAQSDFNLYPDVDPAMLSASLGFSETCLVAM